MKINNKGFALPVSLMLLVVMTLMGATLVSTTSSDIRSNNERDNSSQAFYAAESGITMAKQYLKQQTNYNVGNNPNNQLKFCKTSFFPNLNQGSVRAINNYVGRYNLSQILSVSGKEKSRLDNYSTEYFVTLSPDANGNTSSANKKPGTKNTLYTIYSCGCNNNFTQCRSQTDKIVSLEAVVTIVE